MEKKLLCWDYKHINPRKVVAELHTAELRTFFMNPAQEIMLTLD
jgi:hypothetical protein